MAKGRRRFQVTNRPVRPAEQTDQSHQVKDQQTVPTARGQHVPQREVPKGKG